VVSQGAGLALIGVAIGAGTAMLLTRVLADLLFEVSATDPVSFAAVIFGLVSVALAASYVPALRATRVQPMTVLRGE
jgi:ABC-type antimicrobial peptide transport system permease subunit